MSGRISDYEEKLLSDLLEKFQDLGVTVWGEIEGAPGTYAKILVKPDGTVKVEGVTTVSGSVDVSDKWARQLGGVDIQRYLGSAIGIPNPLHSQMVYGGAVIDPRSIRALVSSDIITVYGSQAQALLQRATTYDLIVQLRSSGVEIDPRSIRALTSSDVVDVSDRAARLLGVIDRVGKISNLQPGLVMNGDFETGTLDGWLTGIVPASIVTSPVYMGTYACKLPNPSPVVESFIRQVIPPTYGDYLGVAFAGRSTAAGGIIKAQAAFSDETYEELSFTCVGANTWYTFSGFFTTHKLVKYLMFFNEEANDKYIDAIQASAVLKTVSASVSDITKVISPSYLAPTTLVAGGTATIVSAPGAGYKLRLKRLQASVNAATRIDFRWGTSAFESYYLPANGSVVINKIGENFEGGANTALTLLSSSVATVTASASTETLAV